MMIHHGSLDGAITRSAHIPDGLGVLRLWLFNVHPCAKWAGRTKGSQR